MPPTSFSALSLHDALPILTRYSISETKAAVAGDREAQKNLRTYNAGDIELTEWLYDYMRPWLDNHPFVGRHEDRKSTRLNSSHVAISYAVFCLKKKK